MGVYQLQVAALPQKLLCLLFDFATVYATASKHTSQGNKNCPDNTSSNQPTGTTNSLLQVCFIAADAEILLFAVCA